MPVEAHPDQAQLPHAPRVRDSATAAEGLNQRAAELIEAIAMLRRDARAMLQAGKPGEALP